jgi:hypothetical protein
MSVVNVKVQYIRQNGYKNLEEWMNDTNNIYIGRKRVVFIDGQRFPKESSIFCNSYKINTNNNRNKVISMYETYIRDKIKNDIICKNELLNLKGKTLGCWCKPESCHGDVLLKIINELLN